MKVINPPLNYAGSKVELLPVISTLFDYSKSTLFDVFTGGGSVAYSLSGKYDKIIMNDINKDLIELQKLFIEDIKKTEIKLLSIFSRYENNKPTKEEYIELRKEFNECDDENRPILFWALSLTCMSNNIRFNKSGKFNQSYGNRGYNSSIENKINAFTTNGNYKLMSENISNISFDNKDTFYYIDPPYYNTEVGYSSFWSKNLEYELLEKSLSSKGSIAISGVIFNHKENSPLLLGLIENKWNMEKLVKSYDGFKKKKTGLYQEVLFTNY